MDFVSFWRTCERMNFVFLAERFVSFFDVPVNVWLSYFGFVSFWRTCELCGFRQFLAYHVIV